MHRHSTDLGAAVVPDSNIAALVCQSNPWLNRVKPHNVHLQHEGCFVSVAQDCFRSSMPDHASQQEACHTLSLDGLKSLKSKLLPMLAHCEDI